MGNVSWHEWLKENRNELYGGKPPTPPEPVKQPKRSWYWAKNSIFAVMCSIFFYEVVKYFSSRRAEQLKEFAIVFGMLAIAMVIYKILKKEKVVW